jgi:hypothetical protein
MRGRQQMNRLFDRWLKLLLAFIVVLLSGLHNAHAAPADPRDTPELASSTPAEVPPIPPDFTTRTGSWYRFAYPKSAELIVKPLIANADSSRADLKAELGSPVVDFVEIRVARSFAEMAALAPVGQPPPSYAVGVAYARSRLIIISLEAPDVNEPPHLPEVFRHELAHVALYDAVGGRAIPRWFNEGFAVHASGESSLARARTLWSATLAKQLLPLSEIERTFPEHSTEASIAYAQSADFVRFLLRRQDRPRFAALIGRIASGQVFEQAISDSYSTDIRVLDFQWREEVKGRYSYVPVFLGGGLLWVGAFAVLCVGWWKRRRQHKKTLERWAKEEAAEDRQRALEEARQAQQRELAAVDNDASQAEQGKLVHIPPEFPVVSHDGRWHTLH